MGTDCARGMRSGSGRTDRAAFRSIANAAWAFRLRFDERFGERRDDDGLGLGDMCARPIHYVLIFLLFP